MIRNGKDSYGLVAIVLHWAIALLIISQLVMGTIMVRLENQRLAFDLIQWHKSFGLLTLALVVIRLAWRLANPLPSYPATVPDFSVMSTTPAVRKPYCAGKAPVIRDMLRAYWVVSAFVNSERPSGSWTPSSRYCRLPWSPRTWTCPKLSCTTPGARSST